MSKIDYIKKESHVSPLLGIKKDVTNWLRLWNYFQFWYNTNV